MSIFASTVSTSWVVTIPFNLPPETSGKESGRASCMIWIASHNGVVGDVVTGLASIISWTGLPKEHWSDPHFASTWSKSRCETRPQNFPSSSSTSTWRMWRQSMMFATNCTVLFGCTVNRSVDMMSCTFSFAVFPWSLTGSSQVWTGLPVFWLESIASVRHRCCASRVPSQSRAVSARRAHWLPVWSIRTRSSIVPR